MTLQEMNNALAKLRLPAIDGAQVELLRQAGELDAFEHGLTRVQANDISAASYLELMVRSVAPSVKAALAELRIDYMSRLVIQAAKRERMELFGALHAIRSKKPNRAEAIKYIRSLGFPIAPTERRPAAPATSTAPYYSFKIFGQAAALCVSEARTRSTQEHTIQIEGAVSLGNGSRAIDWQNKITVQLTRQEMLLLLALLKRLVANVKFEGHGQHHDKAMYVEDQQQHFFVRLIQRGRAPIAVPVRPVDSVSMIALIYKQMQLNEPHLRIDEINQLVKDMAAMMSS